MSSTTSHPPVVVSGAAASVFVLAWIGGLLTPIPDIPAGMDAATIDALASGSGPLLIQVILVHGIAGLALALLVLAVAGRSRVPSAVRVLGILAAALSFGQLACEFVVWSGSNPGEADSWWTAALRIDGAKMLVIAALMVLLLRRTRVVASVTLLAAVSIAVSAIGYLLLHPGLMSVAFVSLPLLLVWAALTGWLPGRLPARPGRVQASPRVEPTAPKR